MLKFPGRAEKPETRHVIQSSFASNYHGTGPFSYLLLAHWEQRRAHAAPASSSCSSATPGFPCSRRSHTEWMEPPEECAHKSRNVILLSAHPPSQWICARTHRRTPQVRACSNAGGRNSHYDFYLNVVNDLGTYYRKMADVSMKTENRLQQGVSGRKADSRYNQMWDHLKKQRTKAVGHVKVKDNIYLLQVFTFLTLCASVNMQTHKRCCFVGLNVLYWT